MRYAVYAPILNDYSDPKRLVDLAKIAEKAGFNGFFIWDHLAIEPDGSVALTDPTVVLAAIAGATRNLTIGAMVTPLARRRPWKVAKEMVALDQLSNGRIVFGAGIGEPAEVEFGSFGEDSSGPARARKLDEGLAILDPLVRGERVSHEGDIYRLRSIRLSPRAVQRPRIPIWIAAALPSTRGLRRAARWDGCFPVKVPAPLAQGTVANAAWCEWWLSPAELKEAIAFLARERGGLSDFSIVATGSTRGDDPAAARAKVAAFAAVGANWWLEWIDDAAGSYPNATALIEKGPPC